MCRRRTHTSESAAVSSLRVCVNRSSRLGWDLSKTQQIVLFSPVGSNAHLQHINNAIRYSSRSSRRLHCNVKSGKAIIRVQVDSSLSLFYVLSCISLYHSVMPEQIQRRDLGNILLSHLCCLAPIFLYSTDQKWL